MAGELTGLRADVPLASRTTLGLGGPASHLVTLDRADDLDEIFGWAGAQALPVAVLGGGSNLVVADRGVRALVVVNAVKGLEISVDGDEAVVTLGAGLNWDETVASLVEDGWCGLECLSGIPGTAGATPIQNVGAYGAEIADVVEWVEAHDRTTGSVRRLPPAECAFAYRNSRFRSEPDRWVVVRVGLRLRRGVAPSIGYPELAREVAATGAAPGPAVVRDIVLDLRRGKGMVVEEGWAPSAGSFFVNPVVDAAALAAIEDRAQGVEVPRYPVNGGGFKVPAAWLIEASGFVKGTRRGPVGLSDHHALALVHHGGGTTAGLLTLAASIREAVDDRFGVRLRPEPVFWGFETDDPLTEVAA